MIPRWRTAVATVEDMDVLEAIDRRRAVREFASTPVELDQIDALLGAAVQAPSAMNMQPWSFAILQDPALLDALSQEVKAFERKRLRPGSPLWSMRATLEDPTYDVFYGAPLVVVICSRDTGLHPEEDCALAAQNLMLAACSLGLGTCPIGIARDWLGQPEVKRELAIPADRTPVFPIAVGHALAEPPPVERHAPEVLVWR